MFIEVLTPNMFAGFVCWREFTCIFLSQSRREYVQVQGTNNEGQGKTKTIIAPSPLGEG